MREGGRLAMAVSGAWVLLEAGAYLYLRFWEWPRLPVVDPIDVALESGGLAILAMALISSIVLARLGAGDVFPGWQALPFVAAVVLSSLVTDLLDEFYSLPEPLPIFGEDIPLALGAFLAVYVMKDWYEIYPESPGRRWGYIGALAVTLLYGASLALAIPLGGAGEGVGPNWAEVERWLLYLAVAVGLAVLLALYAGETLSYIPVQLIVAGFALLTLTPLTHLIESYLGWIHPLAKVAGQDLAPAAFYAFLYMAFVEAFRRAACPRALRVPRVYEAVSLMKVGPSADSWPSAVNAIRKLARSMGIPVVLLTRPGSPLFTIAQKEDLPKVSVLIRPGASFRRVGESVYEVPLKPAFIEGVLRDILRGQEGGALVVFDSITDVMALLDERRAYELIRRLSDLIRERGASGVFLVFPDAHDRRTLALIERMFERTSEA